MKKASVYLVVGLLILSLAGTVAIAAPMGQDQNQNGWYCPYWGQQQTNLTDAQKQELAVYQNQMLEAKKQMLQKKVEWGWITQAQADQYIATMSQHMANGGMMGGGMGMNGMNGGMHGMGRGMHHR